jgi:hypothetical protein
MERRQMERKEFNYSLEFDLGAASGKAGNKKYKAQAQDISTEGLRILTDYPLQKGAVVRLGLPVSGLGTLLPVFAEVAWAAPTDKRFTAGLRFLK